MKRKFIIEICGGIASGKTTLASLFENHTLKPLFENFKKSPFWEAFYTNPGKYIFETEISFILLHYHQIKKALEAQHSLICDFSFLLDLAFAKIGLTGSALNTFECVLDEIQRKLPSPQLIVYLECNAEIQLERIRERARPEEKLINLEFLSDLNKAIYKEVKEVQVKIPIVTIDSSPKDFAESETDRKEMISLISNFVDKKRLRKLIR